MGRYTTRDEVIARFPNAEDMDTVSVESNFIAFAENEIDGLLGQYFTLPFSDNNITIKDLTIELCGLRLSKNAKPSDIDRRHKIFMEKVNRLINGEQAMVLSDGTTMIQSVGDTFHSSTDDYTPIFGFGDIEDMEVDPDLIDDEDDERDS